MEDVEQKQKEDQKKRAVEKKMKKKPSKAVEALVEVEKKEKMEAGQEKVEKKAEARAEVKDKKTAATKKVHVRGKKYQASLKNIDQKKAYSIKESITLLKKVKYAKFDESVELHLNVDEGGLKGELELPHATGKVVRVAIVDDKLLDKLDAGKIEFDVLISHPSFMPKLAKYARTLGPKGLMPNPKTGTISPNPEEVAKRFERGVTRWKTEAKFPLVHLLVGKVSHEDQDLMDNAIALLQAVGKNHIKEVYIKTTMSPSLKVSIENL